MSILATPIYRVFHAGEVAAGAKAYVYLTGTTTPVTTYSNAALTTPNSNPVIADSNGEVLIYTSNANALKLEIRTANDVLIRTLDPVYPLDFSGALSVFTGDTGSGGTKGIVPAPAAGDAAANKFLSASGSWQAPSSANSFVRSAGGRLTLTSNVPVTTSDVTGASVLYYTPYIGNVIALYTGAVWTPVFFTQVSLALSGLTANTLYDLFAWNNAGVVTLETLAWSNSGAGTSARATLLAYQDGVLVRSGDATRRYLGTFRSTGTTTTEDSAAKRFLYNYYNRVKRRLFGTETTSSWTYSTATWRQWNNATNAEYSLVQGVMEDALSHTVYGLVSNSTATARSALVGIGVNSSTSVAGSGGMIGRQAVTSALAVSHFSYATGTLFGFNTIKALEQGAGTDTQTWFGSSSWDVGIIGEGMF